MKIPFLSAFLARRRRSAMRRYMRGYRIMHATGRGDTVEDLRRELTLTSLHDQRAQAPSVIFDAQSAEAERAVRQFLMVRVGGLDLNRALLAGIAEPERAIAHPMPAQWRRVIEAAGWRVDHLRSRLLWAGWLLSMLAQGTLGLLRQIVTAIRTRGQAPLAGSVYFDSLGATNLPVDPSGANHDVISWYLRWDGRARDARVITHGVRGASERRIGPIPIRPVAQPVPLPRSMRAIAALAAWSIRACLTAGFALLRGRWWSAVMLRDAGRAAALRLADTADLPVEYMFHNSNWLYRPFWTHAAERRGVRVLFYFYSTNCEILKRADGYPPQTGSWELCSWTTYLVWNEGQADFVRRVIGADDIRIVGPIGFSDDDTPLPPAGPLSLAAFDIQPMRASFYRSIALGFEYYIHNNACAFAEDVIDVSSELGLKVLWKRKREIGKIAHPTYASLMNRLIREPHVECVAPARAAQHVIARASVVVSMPFTSTALIARAMNKPSCYYDPTGKLQPDDRAAHGIPIIQSRGELKDWIAAHSVIAESCNPERNT